MERDSKFMLKYLLDKKNLPDGSTWFDDFYDKFREYSGWDEQNILACIRYLEDEGYIRFDKEQNGFELEHKAYRKAAFTRQAVISFLIRSVVVPIAVSAATTLLTLLISGLL